jgi:pimeloyl-ACP methyl ester carboxylesterase
MTHSCLNFLKLGTPSTERAIAVRTDPGDGPGLFWLGGFKSDMKGTKAQALSQWAQQSHRACVRFDYSGHGESGGDFRDGTIGRWLEESLAVFDAHCQGPQVVVGSSMGGWIALHVALRRAERVGALVGIAAAPDFTEWGYSAEQKELLRTAGRLELPNPYGPEPHVTTSPFWESGQRLLLLNGEIAIDCPVRLIHGEKDEEVPLEVAFRTMRHVRSADVQLLTIKGGGHRLSEPHEIAAILQTVAGLMEPFE